MIRYKTAWDTVDNVVVFESFVNLIRYKTEEYRKALVEEFESFVNLIRYKTVLGILTTS